MLSGSLWSFQKDFMMMNSTRKSDSRVKNEHKTLKEKLRTLLRLFWRAAAVRHGIPKFWSARKA